MVRWLLGNFSTLLLAFVLAIVVWVVALNEQNPPEVRRFPEPIPIELVGKRSDLVIVGQVSDQASVTLRAPRDVWTTLTRDQIQLTAQVAGLGPGVHEVPVESAISVRTAQVMALSPASLRIRLEPLASREIPVRVDVQGTPGVSYQAGEPSIEPTAATISGPESLVAQVSDVIATVNIEGLKLGLDEVVPLRAVNADGQTLGSVEITPASVRVTLPIEQLGGFKDVAVKIQWEGQVASGYRLTNISVSPPIVTVFSSQPATVGALPGFAETLPLDLTDRRDDIEECIGLALPEGVSLVGLDCVSVVVGVTAIETSLTMQALPVEIEGLSEGLQATPAPPSADVILVGPLPVLQDLERDSVRVVLDVRDLTTGTYQLTPQVIGVPDDVTVSTLLPATIEVTIGPATPTPAP